jgi:hypothetical protein
MKITTFMENLQRDLISKKEVSESTAILYIKNLYRLNDRKSFDNLSFLKDYEGIMKQLEGYADNSRKAFLISISSVLSLMKDRPTYKKLYATYYEIMIGISKVIKEGENHEKTEKEKENWLKMEDIQNKFEELKKDVDKFKDNKTISDNQYDTLLQMMVLAFFVKLAPRRNQDYQLLYFVKKHDDKMDKNVNYLSYDDSKLVFNKYKTSATYGVQELKYNDLKDIIDIYLKFHPLKKGKITSKTNFRFLVYRDGSGLDQVNSLTRILNKIFNRSLGSSMIRHIYLSSKYDIKEMADDAEKMAHSISTQKDYLRKDENVNKTII